jgi:16S rRNA U516 pseudouridylate synthase RsuA-like enzyme
VTLNTGKNREIRRVFAKNNVEITNLKRISIGNFSIKDMKIGQLSQINSN